ncbi:DUF937 domain-containing protein [Planktothrix sp. FACHB-1365]|uniref:DUF937 domain-containing protein n=1 Tax=Planktothrix sp. FACHB-1365 TaxID=2692855 RepID=UPI0016885197|nr:DUF937 domain-containing protein [Planktothrix sp. FACHB-1365]MBD2483677.1 DUF937 domain-containing protein [Planktothrix sp. FACHB-1365]
MGLFDQIVTALNDPNQAGNSTQMGNILNTAQQLGNQLGISPQTSQMVMSMVGSSVRSSLQEKRTQLGSEATQNIVNEFGGTTPSTQAVQMLFSPTQQEQLIQTISQHTGVSSQTLQSLLPIVVPLVLNLLKTGTNQQQPQGGSNPVLNSFLDADGDGDVDVADAMRLAGQYFQS